MPLAIFPLPESVVTPAGTEAGVGISSSALMLVGGKAITSMGEDNDAARLCVRFYPETRDEILRSHWWNCATQRVALALNATAPVFGYAFAYALPSDSLRILVTSLDQSQNGDGGDWEIESGFLLANRSPLYAKYIRRIVNPLEFDTLLTKAITYSLAAKLAYPISQNTNLQDVYTKLAMQAIGQAKAIDGQERAKQRYISTFLTEVR